MNEETTVSQLKNADNQQRRVISCSSSSGIATGGSDRSTSLLVHNFHLQFQPEEIEKQIMQETVNIENKHNINNDNENNFNNSKKNSVYKPFCQHYQLVKNRSIAKNKNLENDNQIKNNKSFNKCQANDNDPKIVNETTNLISRSSSSVTTSTRTSAIRTCLLPYQNFIESDPSFEEMFQIVCYAKLRPTLELEWFDASHVNIFKFIF